MLGSFGAGQHTHFLQGLLMTAKSPGCSFLGPGDYLAEQEAHFPSPFLLLAPRSWSMAGCGLSEDTFLSSFFYNYGSFWETPSNQTQKGSEKKSLFSYTVFGFCENHPYQKWYLRERKVTCSDKFNKAVINAAIIFASQNCESQGWQTLERGDGICHVDTSCVFREKYYERWRRYCTMGSH
ncbi:hypothetical protein H671_1g0223 [Cricetulus griseus]|nr:hypothetical protein H671_1g0223 [Cricetulus griseus]